VLVSVPDADHPISEIGWSASGTVTSTFSADTILSRFAAATLHYGASDAASPVAQTLGVQGVVAGTSNTAGALWTFQDSVGTGTGISGGYAFQVAPAGGTGSTQNSRSTALAIAGGTGSVSMPLLASSSAAQTGTVCWSSTALTYDPTLGCLTSSMRFKHDPEALTGALDEVLRMEPISYLRNDRPDLGRQVGLMAEQIETIDPRLVGLDDQGRPLGVRYMNAVAVLVAAMKEQQAEIADLQRRVR